MKLLVAPVTFNVSATVTSPPSFVIEPVTIKSSSIFKVSLVVIVVP